MQSLRIMISQSKDTVGRELLTYEVRSPLETVPRLLVSSHAVARYTARPTAV